MNNEQWGLTECGFHCPTYTEILNALEYKAREFFGAKANLTVRSPLGLFLRIFAWAIHLLFQLAEDVYNSRFDDYKILKLLLAVQTHVITMKISVDFPQS